MERIEIRDRLIELSKMRCFSDLSSAKRQLIEDAICFYDKQKKERPLKPEEYAALSEMSICSHILRGLSKNYIKFIFKNEFCRIYIPERYIIDNGGICDDYSINAVRYKLEGSDIAYRKKIGKLINELLVSKYGENPPSVNRICEIISQQWVMYCVSKMDLHLNVKVSQDFNWAYGSGNYSEYTDVSCMTDQDVEEWYRSVDAKVATLLNAEGKILSRCIINKVYGIKSQPVYLADCQYGGTSNDRIALIATLIKDGEIDGYKEIGASCHSPYSYSWNNGLRISSVVLSEAFIKTSMSFEYMIEDAFIPYQDTFKTYIGNSKIGLPDFDKDIKEGDIVFTDTDGKYFYYTDGEYKYYDTVVSTEEGYQPVDYALLNGLI